MAIRVAFFRSKRRADLEDPLQSTAHAQLLEQLRGLVEEGGPVEVLHGEEVGAALGCGRHDFWRMCFNKSFLDEVFSSELQDLTTKPEHGVDVGSAQVEESIVEPGVQLHLDGVRDPQRKRGFGPGNHLNGSGKNLVGGRRGWFAFLDLRWTLERNGSGELQG